MKRGIIIVLILAAASGGSNGHRSLSDGRRAELAYGFQESVIDVLVTKTIRAAEAIGARSIVLGGGVAANRVLRDRLAGEADARALRLVVPSPALCTDNGAMIAALGAQLIMAGHDPSSLDFGADSTLPVTTIQA